MVPFSGPPGMPCPGAGAVFRLLGFFALQEAEHFLLGRLEHAVGREPPGLARDQSLAGGEARRLEGHGAWMGWIAKSWAKGDSRNF